MFSNKAPETRRQKIKCAGSDSLLLGSHVSSTG